MKKSVAPIQQLNFHLPEPENFYHSPFLSKAADKVKEWRSDGKQRQT